MNKDFFFKVELNLSSTTKTDRDLHPSDITVSSVNDSFITQEALDARIRNQCNSNIYAAEGCEEEKLVSNNFGSAFGREPSWTSCPGRSHDFFFGTTLPQTAKAKRHVREKLGRVSPPDIGVKVEKDQFSREKSSKAKKRTSSSEFVKSNRRVSCPGDVSNTESLKDISDSSTNSKWITRLFVNSSYRLEADESREVLPKIIESMETMNSKETKLSTTNARRDEIMTSSKSPSPGYFCSEKSMDQIPHEGYHESQKRMLTSALSTRSEGNGKEQNKTPTADKNKTIETTYAVKRHVVPSRFKTEDGNVSTRKVKFDDKRINIHSPSLDTREKSRERSERTKFERKKDTISPNRSSKLMPKSGVLSAEDVFTQKSQSSKIFQDDINLKVTAFLRSSQPMASPKTLKVKIPKKTKASLSNTSVSMRQQRRGDGIFVNTDTCPSSARLIDQDRSWYYQDRRGKCRYLRVPESPVPPVEWVFQTDDD